MADWKGLAFRLSLNSADIFRDKAILLGFFQVKTPYSKSKALLSLVTRPDQYFGFLVIKINQELGLIFFSTI